MFGSMLMKGTPLPVPDSYTKLLIQANGSGVEFVDRSASEHNLAVYGAATQSSAQAKFGGKSIYFAANGWLECDNLSDFDFGSADFTIDCWAFHENLAGHYDYFLSNNDGYMSMGFHGGDGYFCMQGSSTYNAGLLIAFSSNRWYHFAIVRYATTLKVYVDGVLVLSFVIPANETFNPFSSNLSIGTYGQSPYTYSLLGYVDEFRISRGIARWTSNFTPWSVEYI